MKYRAIKVAREIAREKPKIRSFNAQLIPKRLQELALAGVYFDDRAL